MPAEFTTRRCFPTTLLELVAVIRRARLLVAADTGPLHIACAVGTPVVLTRVTDQDSAFLRFLEGSDLTPGQSICVEARDDAADHVVVRGKNNRQIMIGMRAAAKLQVAPAESVS